MEKELKKPGGVRQKVISWISLIVLSIILAAVLRALACPAAPFLGSMAAGIIMAIWEKGPRVPAWTFSLAQGLLGTLVARSFTRESLATLITSWPLLLGGTVWGVIMGALASIFLFRLKILPGSSAFWCLSPGGASFMVLMAEPYGADPRIVAFTQYLRVLLVSLAAVLISSIFFNSESMARPTVLFFPAFNIPGLLIPLVSVFIGIFLARKIPLPGGNFLIPMFLAALIQGISGRGVVLPPWLLYPAYYLIGWRIGLSFTRQILLYLFKAIPAITLALFLMLLGCALFGLFLVKFLGLSPLTAYLATCPGGLDAVTIIASGSVADLSFVVTMQAMRLILIILAGPRLYCWLTRRAGFSKIG
ncbi:MAG: AbrB family transcriptional regulator [Deltaproteobacteria bacterium]|nr:AbrB family transcriptional regulator [Deltaproteobacteria bacterium]